MPNNFEIPLIINHALGAHRILAIDAINKAIKKPAYKIFWGGADLDPSFYNRERSDMCGHSDKYNDEDTINQMKEMIEQGIPIIGICRGAQVLNVVNGGILTQHIEGHTHSHDISLYDIDGDITDVVNVTSTHHQMMIPHKSGIILGKDQQSVVGKHWDNVNEDYIYKYVIEVVYYPETKSLCIQPHPEWMNQEKSFIKWINQFIKEQWGIGPINFAKEEHQFLIKGE